MNKENARYLAVTVLLQLQNVDKNLSQLLPKLRTQLPAAEFGLLQELTYGACRWYFQLTAVAQQLLSKPLKEKDQDVYWLILLGIYQLQHLNIPAHAVVMQTAEVPRLLGKAWAVNLINAVLRRFLREKESLLKKLHDNVVAEYAHPRWLLDKIRHAWPKQWQTILTANNQRPPLTLRVNQQLVRREQYLTLLQQHGITATACASNEHAIILATPLAVRDIPGFADGLCSVQDASAQFAADLLELAPRLHVLDACAAPGGKTTHIMEIQADVTVVAVEQELGRIEKIQQNLTRLKQQATIYHADAAATTTWWDGVLFQRILLDAPCSATGIIRRHPDIKLLRTQEDIAQLQAAQLRLLMALWPLLEIGGILVYATCSILPEENERVVEKFLQQHEHAVMLPIDLPCGVKLKHGWQILPDTNNMDGFYYAKLRKQ